MIIVPFSDQAPVESVGVKGRTLCRLAAAGLPVPAGFCVTVEGLKNIAASRDAVESALNDLESERVAVRSSAIEEDCTAASFAGIYLSRLNVSGVDSVIQSLEDVRSSAWSSSAIAYRRRCGIVGPPAMAAVVQTLVNAAASGVLFMRDPIEGSSRIVVEASWGLGEAVVQGLVTPDRWILSSQGDVINFKMAGKDVEIVPHGNSGTNQLAIDDNRRGRPCLDADSLKELVRVGRICEELLGVPQEIEWSIAADTIWILQSRPIVASPAHKHRLNHAGVVE